MDVDSKDTKYGQTPLLLAVGNGYEAVVKALLATGKVDIDSWTPPSWTPENMREAVVKALLATGKVDVDSKDTKYGRTPLLLAAGNGYKVVVKALLAMGKVDVDSKDTEYG